MLVAFPAPVLSVTADAVRELEGSEALSGLWTLFTKCKESLKDGRRLENISWRLWYRELMLAGPSSEKKSEGDGGYRPLTPTLDLNERISLPLIPIHPSVPPTRKPSSLRRSGSVNRGNSMSVGKVIYDMLPPPNTTMGRLSISPSNPTSVALPAATMGATIAATGSGLESEPRPVRFHLSILPLLPLPEPTTTREAVISAAESLPTPALEDVGGGYVSSGRVAESSTAEGSTATTQMWPSYVQEIGPGQGVQMVYAGPPSPSLSETYALAHPGEVPPNTIQSSAKTPLLSSQAMALVSQPPSSTASPLPSSTLVAPSANPLPSTIPPPTQISIQTPTPRTPPPPPTLVVVNPTPNPTPHPTPPATPAPVLLGAGERRAHGQYLALPGRAGTPSSGGGSVQRNSGATALGEDRMSAGEVRASAGAEARTKVDVRQDGLGADVQFEADAGFEPHGKDATNSDSKPYQRHQKDNSTSSTSSRASSSVSVFTGTTGVTSANASDVDLDEAMEHHISKVVHQEAHVISSEVTSTTDDYLSPSPSPSPAAEASIPKSHTHSPKSTSTNADSHSPKPSHSRSPSTTTTTARSRALHPAPATAAIARRASSGGTSQTRSRPPLSASGAPTSAKSKSRSRSRDAGGAGGLALGMTKKVGGGAGGGRVKLGGLPRGKLGGNGLGKGLSRKGSRVDVDVGEREGEQGEEREALNVRAEREYLAKMREREVQQPENHHQREREGKKSALFDIGSHSDNGSKSTGSGSDVSALVGGVHDVKVQGAYEGTREGAAARTHEVAARKCKDKEREVGIREEEETHVHRDKANQKEKEYYKAKQKEREAATAAAVAANLALAAQQLAQLGAPLLPQQLAAPLLPQQQRRTIVLATSESDYETDSDDDEDGSWSSEEMSGDENVHQVEVKHAAPPPPPPPAPVAPPIVHQAHHRIPPIQRTVSNNATTTRTSKPLSRAQIHRAQAQANTQAIMEKAAAEAQRQRDMFIKLPVVSAQNLGGGPSRTRSAGLLTQLLNPPLDIFPANHPYRRGYSSGEIRAGQQGQGQQQKGQGQARLSNAPGPSNAPSGPPRAPGGIQVSKSAAALPISSQVQVGSVYGKGVALAAMPVMNGNGNVNVNGTGGYRPKGRPQGQELEDDSGSEDEANAGIQVSKSVAQERLKALAQRRGIVTHGKQKSMGRLATLDDNAVPPWALGPQPPPPPTGAYGQLRRQASDRLPYPEEHPPTPTPIPVGHPYNLPPPAAPSTPRTTRRQMLQTEMSESLRRNLLWERQVSKVNLVGYRASTNGGRNNVLGGLKPLTTTPSMVQLRAKGEAGNAAAGPSNGERTKSSDREWRGGGGGEPEERRWLAVARNKSWADDYHFKGW